jgi:two-component system sensor histidine kinase AlgZ
MQGRPMKESQILSSFSDPPAGAATAHAPAPARVQLFDACHVGVVLRAVLFVEAVMGVGAMFGARDPYDWLLRSAVLSAGALPGTLAWLLAACSVKRLIARCRPLAQRAFGVGLGALAGVYGCAMQSLASGEVEGPWLASAFTGALLSAALVGALVWRAKGRMPAETAARLAELQARIRPHFLFNTLNSAVALVRQDPARAEAVLEDLADLFRHALADRGEAVTLSEEVSLARRYLAIEQVRFGDRLQVEWALDARAGGAKVPPMLLQPLVENAVRHGVEPSDVGAQVRVSTERRGGMVVIKVTNTVPAGQGPRGQGVAQDNVRDRLALLHDVHGQFRAGLRDSVYEVRIEVPA